MKSLYDELPTVEIAGRKFVGRVLFSLLVLISALVGATAGLLLVYTTDLPQVDALENYRPSSITELYDDRDRVIGSFALQRRVVASYEDFPPVLRDALVSIEDKDFYTHSGINFWRIVGAAYRDVESGGRVQGASTLTMQLARNLFLSPDRSFHRKVQETMLAIQIERRFTKPQIFTLYANQIFLGHGVYGFESASEYYFSKPARQLTLDEAALLAARLKDNIGISADIRVAAVNDLTSAQTLANLLKYDSVYGPLSQQVVAEGSSIRIGNTVVEVLSERDPAQLPWRRLGVDVVMESTGVFNDAAKARAHIDAGASKVVVSAAAKNADLTLVIGVNDDLYDPEKHTIVSNASCTTNCLAPMARVLDDALGIECGGDFERARISFDDRSQAGAAPVELVDAA